MIGRVGVFPVVVGAVLVLATGCSQAGQSGTSSGDTARTPASASPAGDLTNKDLCTLVNSEALTRVAFPVAAGRPLSVGAFRACRFPASDGAGRPVPDSVMLSALPSGAAGFGQPVTVKGVTGSKVSTSSECTLLLNAKGGTLQVVVGRAGKGAQQCAIAESVAAVVLDRL